MRKTKGERDRQKEAVLAAKKALHDARDSGLSIAAIADKIVVHVRSVERWLAGEDMGYFMAQRILEKVSSNGVKS